MRGRETDRKLLILAMFAFPLGIASLWGELVPQLSMCGGGLLQRTACYHDTHRRTT
jgi:hypothetical protein